MSLLSFPVHKLPVELLSRIFLLGSFDASEYPFHLKPDEDYYAAPSTTFQLNASHVCRHWRTVALRTPSLWTTLHFREPAHLQRAALFISRCTHSNHPLDILVDTVAHADHIPGVTLCRAEFDPIFSLIVPHIARWRAFVLKIRDTECKAAARRYLSQCGPAPSLETLQLYHFEDFRTSGDLYQATYRPPVQVFNNALPRLRNISLIGVNLPWADAPFLKDLVNLELALHSESIRPSYAQWAAILQASPSLTTLSLHYSGPRAPGPPNSPDAWPSKPNPLPLRALTGLSLTDLDPDYLCLLFAHLDMPALLSLSLELPEQDFTPFVDILAASHSDAQPEDLPGGLFPHLRRLRIAALDCTSGAWYRLLTALPKLVVLDADFARTRGGLYAALLGKYPTSLTRVDGEPPESPSGPDSTIPNHIPPMETTVFIPTNSTASTTPSPTASPTTAATTPDAASSPGRAIAVVPGLQLSPQLLPLLDTVRTAHLSGERLAALIAARPGVRHWAARWCTRWSGRDAVLDQLVACGWDDEGRHVEVEGFEEEGDGEEEEDEGEGGDDGGSDG